MEADKPASVSVDKQPPVAMTNVPGTKYWYKLMTLRLGTTHNYNYFVEGRSVGTYDVAGYNPDSYPLPGVARGKLSEMKTLASKIYPGMTANYWVYVNPGADLVRGAPLMVWQDGETIVGNQDLLRLRLQIVSDNLVHKKLIPPMVHVLISPGSGGEAQGTRMRSIQYDTVSDRYGKYLLEEVLPEVEKSYKLRPDAYSRAIAGASSGAICALNVAWYHTSQFSRVLSHIGSYVALQWQSGAESGRRLHRLQQGAARAQEEYSRVVVGRYRRPGDQRRKLAAQQYSAGQRAQAEGLRFSFPLRRRHARDRAGRAGSARIADLVVAGLRPGEDRADL